MPDHRKEVDSEVTIATIKQILNSVGFTEDKTTVIWNHAYGSFYSCALIFNEYPPFKSNGKGLSKKLAPASAYAEFIERLQCFAEYAFFTREKKGVKKKNLLFPHKYVDTEKLLKNLYQIYSASKKFNQKEKKHLAKMADCA